MFPEDVRRRLRAKRVEALWVGVDVQSVITGCRDPQANLVAGMKWFQNTCTRRLNTRHGKWGHVFGGRYKAVVVQSSEERGGDYLCSLIDYVHLNPVRAGLVRLEEGMGLLDYPWKQSDPRLCCGAGPAGDMDGGARRT